LPTLLLSIDAAASFTSLETFTASEGGYATSATTGTLDLHTQVAPAAV